MEKQIVIIKPKSLSPKDKEKLTKAGNIVIEHEKADEITFKPHSDMMEFIFTNCSGCGERIYLLREREMILRAKGHTFYCSQGHANFFKQSK